MVMDDREEYGAGEDMVVTAYRAAPMAMPPPPPPPAPVMQAQQGAPAPTAAAPPPAISRSDRVETERAAATDRQAFDAAAAADRAADEPGEDVPPATADSPAVRDAWLQRIRELVAAGERDAARTSLQEFVRRHPDQPLPDDLRQLLR
jgi:hypothetical protein